VLKFKRKFRRLKVKCVLLICVLDSRVNGKNNEARHLLLMMCVYISGRVSLEDYNVINVFMLPLICFRTGYPGI
jgi:hypothetical protein